jgi:hypothetical protein
MRIHNKPSLTYPSRHSAALDALDDSRDELPKAIGAEKQRIVRLDTALQKRAGNNSTNPLLLVSQ